MNNGFELTDIVVITYNLVRHSLRRMAIEDRGMVRELRDEA